jgi:hypothetical protein
MKSKRVSRNNGEPVGFEELTRSLLAVPKAEVDEKAVEYEKEKDRKHKSQVPKDREITE